MIQYILECIAFQLVFLIIYDFFLRRETFFQWNRVYLIGTYALSIILPWIKIEAFRTKVSAPFIGYSEFLWSLDQSPIVLESQAAKEFNISWQETLLITGSLFALIWFGLKIWRLYQLRQKGNVHYFKNFTRILVPESNIAFSFFKSIFLGEKVPEKEYNSIISHELVHIRQRHTLDLLFFELMRIVNWFNPLVYVYQRRISELHEFIADAHVPKAERNAHYELLLSQAFQTQNISFVNQFFKSSLIKKRIVMLQKTKSKGFWQLKYLVLVPVVLSMLFYNSCKQNEASLEQRLESLNREIEERDSLTAKERDAIAKMANKMLEEVNESTSTINGWKVNVGLNSGENKGGQSLVELYNNLLAERKRLLQSADESNPIIVNLDNQLKSIKDLIDGSEIPFAIVDQVPVFPGCENVSNQRECFNEMIQKHISKNFNYPEEALKNGIQGRVKTMFMIQADGTIDNIRMRGPDKLLENEVERIIKRLPRMAPGKHEGKSVDVPFSIPVTFKLD